MEKTNEIANTIYNVAAAAIVVVFAARAVTNFIKHRNELKES